ncbi:MAG: hypothetical protein ACXVCP_02225 [Bdellovibrio sp.]
MLAGINSQAVECKSSDGQKKIEITQDPGAITLWEGNKELSAYNLITNSGKNDGSTTFYEFINTAEQKIEANLSDLNYMTGSDRIRVDGIIYLCPQDSADQQ